MKILPVWCIIIKIKFLKGFAMENYTYRTEDFFISRILTSESAHSEYKLHNHENLCEILFFINGDSSFLVEGTEYNLSQGDFIIARPDEMHRVIHHSESLYERMVINFGVDFLRDSGCEEYEKAFFERPAGSANLFRAHSAGRAADTLYRLSEYAEENAPEELVKGVLLELIRAIAKCTTNASEGNVTSPRLREIILFINDNLTSPLSLDSLSEKFFISKYHLCRLFKSQTGLTVGKYITKKRLMLAETLHSSGLSLTEAALNSGFGDYSSFWHARNKEK